MFFFNMSPEEELDKDCFMKQKPFNDNLVMASIESLYEQASHTVHSITGGLQRHNPKNLPIIGSLPIQIGQKEELGELDDIVLTGRLHAVFADEDRTKIAAETDTDKEEERNPFLEIRQAIIAAGNNNNQKLKRSEPSARVELDSDIASVNAPALTLPDELAVQSIEHTFAKQLANLIDAEIERRMAGLMQASKKPSNRGTSAKQTRTKQRKTAKRSKKPTEKATRKPVAKRPSTAKRMKPK